MGGRVVGCCFGVGRCWEMIKIVDIGSDYLILIKLRLVDMMSAGNYNRLPLANLEIAKTLICKEILSHPIYHHKL